MHGVNMNKSHINIYFLKNIYTIYTLVLIVSTLLAIIGFAFFGAYPINLFNLVALPNESLLKLEDLTHPAFILILLIGLTYWACKKYKSLSHLDQYDIEDKNFSTTYKAEALSYIINIAMVALIIMGSIQFHGWINPEYKDLQKHFSSRNYDAFFKEVDTRFKYQMDRNYLISQIRYSNRLNSEQIKRVVEAKNAIRAQYTTYLNKNSYSLTVLSTLSKKEMKDRDYSLRLTLFNGLFLYLLTACIFIGNQYFLEFQKAYRNA